MTKTWEPLTPEYSGNAVVVNGMLLHEDMYRLDMLNRALADFCNASTDYRVRQLMAWMHNDTLVHMMVPNCERVPVTTLKYRYEYCLAEADPIAGFALLRSASMVNLLVELVHRYCGSNDGETAVKMVKDHLPDVFRVLRSSIWYVVDDLTAKQISALPLRLPHGVTSFEVRSLWYAAAQGLPKVAASLYADMYLMQDLYVMLGGKLSRDGRWHAKDEVDVTLARWWSNLLARQMQAVLVKMTGSVFAQQGMSREDAEGLLRADTTLTAVA